MGMYTGLRIRAKIKPEYHEMLQQLYTYYNWSDVSHRFDIARQWSFIARCNFIPFGAICYLDWDENDPDWTNQFKDGVWQFQCSLKNYNGEIQQFIQDVLSVVTEELYYGEYQYECDEKPTKIILKG